MVMKGMAMTWWSKWFSFFYSKKRLSSLCSQTTFFGIFKATVIPTGKSCRFTGNPVGLRGIL